jgi:hypothetical protein
MRGGVLERGRIIMTNQRRGKDNGAFNSRTRENIRPSESWGGKGGEPRAQVIIMGQGGLVIGEGNRCLRSGQG